MHRLYYASVISLFLLLLVGCFDLQGLNRTPLPPDRAELSLSPTPGFAVPAENLLDANPYDDPVIRSVHVPQGAYLTQNDSVGLAGSYGGMMSGGLSYDTFVEIINREGPKECSIEARFIVEGRPDARVLVYVHGNVQTVKLLPRDILAEFPFARTAPRARWFEVIKSGEVWEKVCGSIGGDLTVTSGHVGLLFNSAMDGNSPCSGRSRLVLSDITFNSDPGFQWEIPPNEPDLWLMRWVLLPLYPSKCHGVPGLAAPAKP